MIQYFQSFATLVPFGAPKIIHLSLELIKAPLLPFLGLKQHESSHWPDDLLVVGLNITNYFLLNIVAFLLLAVDEALPPLPQLFDYLGVVISQIDIRNLDSLHRVRALLLIEGFRQHLNLALNLLDQEFLESD